MTGSSDRTLRVLGIALFAAQVTANVAYLALSPGIAGQPGLTYPYEVHATSVLMFSVPGAVGMWLVWLRPRHPAGWLIGLSGLCLSLSTVGSTYGARALVVPGSALPGGELVLSLTQPLWIPGLFLCVTHLLVRYPSGRVEGRWARRFDRAALVGFVLMYAGYATSGPAVTDVVEQGAPPLVLPEAAAGTLMVTGGILILASAALIVGDAVRRARRSAGPDRMALIWLLTTGVAAVVVIFIGPYEWTAEILYSAVLVAVAVGVLRYRVLGVDVIVRRTLTYALLTGLVVLVLVGAVAAATRLVPTGPLPELVAAVLVAVVLSPARDRIQRGVDRLLYGERDDPVAALSRLTTSMDSVDDDHLLPSVLEALARALRVDGVAVAGTVTASYGVLPEAPERVPLVFAGEHHGDLLVGLRRGEPQLSDADRRLLVALAPLLAAVVRSLSLAADVRAEQSRVVEATQVERARLRQELHDGLGPSLTGIGLGLEALQPSVDARGAEMVERLRSEAADALTETRRIIDDLAPVALDGDSLPAAIRRRVEQVSAATGLDVTFTSPDDLTDLPVPVTVAAYRIVDEALTNVVRHAGASRCRVQIAVEGCLHLEVSDNGVGPGAARAGGVGLPSMRGRAERLGGRFTLSDADPGTTVTADLPLVVAP